MMKARIIHQLWRWGASSATKKFIYGLKNTKEAQSDRLRNILYNGRGSIFSSEHGIGLNTTTAEFRSKVPLRNWEEFRPWTTQVEAGIKNVLSNDPVCRLVPTSGSSQACKLVPTGVKLVSEYRAALDPWVTGLLNDEPQLAEGCSYWAISPPNSFTQNLNSKIPIGFEDDAAYFGPLASLVSILQAVPKCVTNEKSTFLFKQRTLSYLLRRHDLCFVSIWHPSFFELLLSHLRENWESLLHIVTNGNPEWNGILRHGDSIRAKALRNFGPRVSLIWPKLSVISAWCHGSSEGPSKALSELIPAAKIIPKGLVATEGVVSIPWSGKHPLAITSHFLEFLDEAGNVRCADEIEIKKRYEVIITTSGGLWRYRTGDIIEVDGFIAETPSIRFLGRQGGVVDLCGEKLNEIHVTKCLESLNKILRPAVWRMIVPAPDGKGYLLLLDESILDGVTVVELLEQQLLENPHYEFARNLGQLRKIEVKVVPTGARIRVIENLVANGHQLGATKLPILNARTDWVELLS